MIIRCFRSAKMENTIEYDVTKITGIDEFDEDEKEIVRNGGTPMLNCTKADGSFIAIPVEFVIEIRE